MIDYYQLYISMVELNRSSIKGERFIKLLEMKTYLYWSKLISVNCFQNS